MTSTSTQTNPPPAFSISSSGPESPPSVLTPELFSDFIYPKKGSNWRTVVINANSITHKMAEISAMADYCDPDLMLIVETKLDSSRVQNGSPGSTRFYGPVHLRRYWSVPVSTGPYILGRPVKFSNSQDADNLHTIRKRMPIPFQ